MTTATSNERVRDRVGPHPLLPLVPPALAVIIWVVYVSLSGQWDRVLGHWASSITMIFGSFLAGSSPEGGGAVAFPVFTKVLHIGAPVARSFSLFIQAVGMTMATLAILITRRTIDVRSVIVGSLAGTAGFVFSVAFLTRSDDPFRSPIIAAPWVKVTFTLLLAAMSLLMYTALKRGEGGLNRVQTWNPRVFAGLAVGAFVGGGLSAFTGTGVNVLLFLFVVVMCGVSPRVGVASSIVTMTVVSVTGVITLGILGGQLSTQLGGDGSVVAVGGAAVPGLDASRFDLFALWLAAVPIVVWGAPLGTWVVSRVSEHRLVAFVAMLAGLEVVTTLILVEEIRQDPALLAYTIGGLVLIPPFVRWLAASRHRLLDLPPSPVPVAPVVGTGGS